MDDHDRSEAPVASHVREVSDGIARLIKDHIELAKAELQAGFRKAAKDMSLGAAGAFLLLLGWVLLMFAAGFALGDVVGDRASFLIIASVHLVVGFVLVAVYGSKLQTTDKPGLPKTTVELSHDRQFLHRLSEIIRPEAREHRPA